MSRKDHIHQAKKGYKYIVEVDHKGNKTSWAQSNREFSSASFIEMRTNSFPCGLCRSNSYLIIPQSPPLITAAYFAIVLSGQE